MHSYKQALLRVAATVVVGLLVALLAWSNTQHQPSVTPTATAANLDDHDDGPSLPTLSPTQHKLSASSPREGPISGDATCELHFDPTATTQWEVEKNAYASRGCPRRISSVACRAKVGKALVLYMLHSKAALDVQHEFWNFHYFTKFGIYGEHQETALFSGVDYVFSRMIPSMMDHNRRTGGGGGGREKGNVTLCSELGNVKLVSLPPHGCDLCHHSRVIDFLGGVEAVKRKYAYVVYMNAGVRGPFQHEDDAHWIDVVAMGGQRYLGGRLSHPVATGLTISYEHKTHIQSFFMGFPTKEALSVVYGALRSTCNLADKRACIYKGETAIGTLLLEAGLWLHSTVRNFTVHDEKDMIPYKQRILNWKFKSGHIPKWGNIDPLYTELDLCAGMFSKFGGTFVKTIPPNVVAAFAQLTALQSTKRHLDGGNTISQMLRRDGSKCPWLAID